MNQPLIREDRLMGIKYWAIYQYDIPKFIPVKYIGKKPDTGSFFFITLKAPTQIVERSFYQLYSNNFRPFCLNMREIDAYLEKAHNANL